MPKPKTCSTSGYMRLLRSITSANLHWRGCRAETRHEDPLEYLFDTLDALARVAPTSNYDVGMDNEASKYPNAYAEEVAKRAATLARSEDVDWNGLSPDERRQFKVRIREQDRANRNAH